MAARRFAAPQTCSAAARRSADALSTQCHCRWQAVRAPCECPGRSPAQAPRCRPPCAGCPARAQTAPPSGWSPRTGPACGTPAGAGRGRGAWRPPAHARGAEHRVSSVTGCRVPRARAPPGDLAHLERVCVLLCDRTAAKISLSTDLICVRVVVGAADVSTRSPAGGACAHTYRAGTSLCRAALRARPPTCLRSTSVNLSRSPSDASAHRSAGPNEPQRHERGKGWGHAPVRARACRACGASQGGKLLRCRHGAHAAPPTHRLGISG
jgi:hypothetical protein